MHRRTFVTGLAALGALSSAGRAFAAPATEPEFSDADLLDSVLSEIKALSGKKIETVATKRIAKPSRAPVNALSMSAEFVVPRLTPELIAKLQERKFYDIKPESSRPAVAWPDIAVAPDYIHLENYAAPDARFTLTADTLAWLASRNDFPLAAETGIVVFGLRGCEIEGGAALGEWAKEHKLREATPTHLAPRCVMGLWRKSDNLIAVFRASTVPAAHNMYTSLAASGNGTSLLPTGLYTYKRGNHKASDETRIQRGALLIQGTYPVLRTSAELEYDPFRPTTAWTRGALHNIHAAGMGDRYDSAGCQVVQGSYVKTDRLKTLGAWDTFRRFAGTVDAAGAAPPSTAQSTFRYMLLTGREAALAAKGAFDFANGYEPLRIGSKGARVTALQEKLLTDLVDPPLRRADGDFGMNTAFGAIMNSKNVYGDSVTGIAS